MAKHDQYNDMCLLCYTHGVFQTKLNHNACWGNDDVVMMMWWLNGGGDAQG
jgi:hypothetical protein